MKGKLFNRRVTFLRRGTADDGLQSIPGPDVELGTVWAAREDVSDAERLKSGERAAELQSRYIVRSTVLTRDLSARDILREGGGPKVEIFGVKTVGHGALIEITTLRRSDKWPA